MAKPISLKMPELGAKNSQLDNSQISALNTSSPYCEIPEYFFQSPRANRKQHISIPSLRNYVNLKAPNAIPSRSPRTLFSIQTWDGRDVMSLEEDS